MMREIYKEIKFGVRNSRFLVLIIGFMFFAVLNPVMTKVVLPQVLASQFPGMTEQALSSMFDMSQLGSIRSYMGDVFEIGSIIVAFTLCGLIAQEIKDNTLVLPLCSGKRLNHIVGAKMLVFGTALVLITTLALIVDYVYAGLLFSFDIGFMPILRAGLLQGLYMVFLLACVMVWGAILKSPIAAGLSALASVYGLQFVSSLLNIQGYLPPALLAEAQALSAVASPSLTASILSTGLIIAGCLAITLLRLNNMEWNLR